MITIAPLLHASQISCLMPSPTLPLLSGGLKALDTEKAIDPNNNTDELCFRTCRAPSHTVPVQSQHWHLSVNVGKFSGLSCT